ncbi:MAG TPA: hypothetical protein VLM85_06785 [Polyangiaceae bacterium]|nr:hypothetical protein [Polyangiaceae bacterium]
MKRGWLWVSLATVLFACNADQFVGGDASPTGDATSPDAPIVSGGDAGDGAVGCGDTQSSPDNCGACGHSCQGGACNNAFCQPAVFTSMQPNLAIDSLALDDTRLYMGSDVVYACPRSGCGSGPQPITSLVYGQSGAQNIVGIAPFTQNSNPWMVYVNYGLVAGGAYGFVGACPVGSCLGTGSGHLFDMNAASSTFVHLGTGYAAGGGVIRQFPLDGGGPSTFASASHPLSVSAVDDAGDVAFCAPGYGVYACNTSGCSNPTLLSTPATTVIDIAIFNHTVYWSDAVTGLVDSCPLAGCSNTPTHVIPTSPGAIGDIVIGANGRLFYAVNSSGSTPSPNSGSIQTCQLGSCSSPTTIAAKRNFPWHLVAGGSTLYWSEGTQLGQTTPFTTNQVVLLAL